MSQVRLRPRTGMTLPELLTALVLMGIIGTAATGVFISQSQLYDHQEKLSSARSVSRSAVNMLLSELRMLEQGGGFDDATGSAITVRVPFAFGVTCKSTSSETVVSLLPGDAEAWNRAVNVANSYDGYAWRIRDELGNYTYVPKQGSTKPSTTSANDCDAQRVKIFAGGGAYNLKPGAGASVLPGTPVLIYHTVTYEFKASTELGGRIGLYRTAGSDADELITGPFDDTAGFQFYIGNSATAGAAPSDLTSITGLQLVLDGLSERPAKDGSFQPAPLTTSLFFWNRTL